MVGNGNLLAKGHVPEWRRDCATGAARSGMLVIRGLENGSMLRAPAGQRREVQLTLTANGAQGNIYWMLDGSVVSTLPSARALSLPVNRDGHHELTAIDELGRNARVSFDARGFAASSTAFKVAVR